MLLVMDLIYVVYQLSQNNKDGMIVGLLFLAVLLCIEIIKEKREKKELMNVIDLLENE